MATAAAYRLRASGSGRYNRRSRNRAVDLLISTFKNAVRAAGLTDTAGHFKSLNAVRRTVIVACVLVRDIWHAAPTLRVSGQKANTTLANDGTPLGRRADNYAARATRPPDALFDLVMIDDVSRHYPPP